MSNVTSRAYSDVVVVAVVSAFLFDVVVVVAALVVAIVAVVIVAVDALMVARNRNIERRHRYYRRAIAFP